MKTKHLFPILLIVMSLTLSAQDKVFDPSLDSTAMLIPQPEQEQWQSQYMWYPGQLAAFYQAQSAAISKTRCTHVGYPGNFFAKCNKAYFKREVNLKKATTLEWAGPETITLSIDGKQQAIGSKSVTIPAGKSILRFEVSTRKDLPCIILKGEGLDNPIDWQASMDDKYYTIAETDKRYKSPAILPDSNHDVVYRLKPTTLFPLRNARVIGDSGFEIGKNGYVLIDFTHLEIGQLVFKAKGDGKITVRVGETPEEALERDEKTFEQYPIPAIKVGKTEKEFKIIERALRYASIETDKGVTITDICFDAAVWPVEHQMTFDCDDSYINDIFKMSAATLHTSMHRFYLDGVKRDFLPWSMDALLSTVGGDYLFGDQQVSKNGISIALMPKNPQKGDIGIPDYPLHALFGLKINYLRYGDLTTSLQYKDRIIELLDFYSSIVDENGFLHGDGDRRFGFTPGWSVYNGPHRKGIASYAQIMLYYNYQTGAFFADKWNEKKLSAKWRKQAEQLKTKIMEKFWSDEKRAFINGTMNDITRPDGRISHHAQYWAILAGIFPEEHIDNLFDNILPKLKDYYNKVSYEKGYEFLAYAKCGRVKEMWHHIDIVFGDWMRQGHTRFPENFMPHYPRNQQLKFYNRTYGLSLCHGANGVPGVVGILFGLIGFSQDAEHPGEYTIKPNMLHLKRIDARIPVKEGFITVHLSADGKHKVDAPQGCKVIIK